MMGRLRSVSVDTVTIRLSPKICGGNVPVGWILLNPEWPHGTDSHLRRCEGCAECAPDDPAKWLEPPYES